MMTGKDLARVILKMNYRELMNVSGRLSGMVVPDVRPKIETPEEYAEALYDWAEAELEGEQS